MTVLNKKIELNSFHLKHFILKKEQKLEIKFFGITNLKYDLSLFYMVWCLFYLNNPNP